MIEIVNFWTYVLENNPNKSTNIMRLLELLDTGYIILK